MKEYYYKTGDVVKVWSLQSFFGGGFLDGETAIVRQNQMGRSVILIVSRKPKFGAINDVYQCSYVLDTSYEVYDRQVDLVKKATEEEKRNVERFLRFNDMVRKYESDKIKQRGSNKTISYNYSPECYIDDDFNIRLNKDIFQYPELYLQVPELFI